MSSEWSDFAWIPECSGSTDKGRSERKRRQVSSSTLQPGTRSTIRKLVQFEHKRPYLLQVVDLELSRVGWDDVHALGLT